uniref:SCP domain-containing protein n=1 Tax=Thermosporothrix sp. COM3 TaxID=2490863 RepID=A0A455SXP9_9CHLR|nr:hypothetical protein KTC_46750 [Thermosporothrix sp. COM3]
MSKKLWFFSLCLGLGFLLAACAEQPPTTGNLPPTPTLTVTSKPTEVIQPKHTPTATVVPATPTPKPTRAPEQPTVVPTTPIPEPTRAPEQPTVVPTTPPVEPTTPPAQPTEPPVQPTKQPGTTDQLVQQLLAQINQDRAANGLPAYTWDDGLALSATRHTQTMIQNGELSHQLPSEPGLGQRITAAGVDWRAVGENIAYTTQTNWQGVYGVHKSMLNEQPPNDGHRKNYLSTTFHRIGISIIIDQTGKLWLTEDFAN